MTHVYGPRQKCPVGPPRTGHTAILEEPDVFNCAVDTFLSSAERGATHPVTPAPAPLPPPA